MKRIFEVRSQQPHQAMTRRTVLSTTGLVGAAATSAMLLPKTVLAQTSPSAMTAAEAADVVRRGYRAFATADMAALTQLFDADSTWETPGKSPVAGVRKGRDNVFAQFGTYGAGTEGTFKAELLHVTADGEGHVVGIHRNTGKRKGRMLDTMCCLAFEAKGGRIISGKEHFLDIYNWDAFWA